MLKKIKQTRSEKILIIFIFLLAFFSFGSFYIIKNKCLFVDKINLQKLSFNEPDKIVILNVPCGNVVIKLVPEISPNSVKRFTKLIKNNEYNDVAFHRVIKDFLVQTGDIEFGKKGSLNYTFLGTGKSGYGSINSELSKSFKFKEGGVGFARKGKDTEDSQFFILLKDAPLYTGEFTPIGQVIYGLDALKKIKHRDKSEYVLRPDYINFMKILSDLN